MFINPTSIPFGFVITITTPICAKITVLHFSFFLLDIRIRDSFYFVFISSDFTLGTFPIASQCILDEKYDSSLDPRVLVSLSVAGR